MDTLVTTLRDHLFLRGLDDAHLARIAGCACLVDFPGGAFLLREGGEASALYLITSGRVTLEIQVPARGAVQVESLHGGDILGLHWLFPPRSWVLDARAVTAVTAVRIDAAGLRALMDGDAALGYAVSIRLLRQLYDRLERVRLQRLDVYRKGP
ncbi:MAG: cyclic nucleotide-binding domain-containing protein [Minicystis sp.]